MCGAMRCTHSTRSLVGFSCASSVKYIEYTVSRECSRIYALLFYLLLTYRRRRHWHWTVAACWWSWECSWKHEFSAYANCYIMQAEKQQTWPQLRYLPIHSTRSRKMKSNVRWVMMCALLCRHSSSVRHLHFRASKLKVKLNGVFFFLHAVRIQWRKVNLSDLKTGYIFRRWCVLFAINSRTFVAIWMHVTLVSVSFCQTRYARGFDVIEVSSSIKRRHASDTAVLNNAMCVNHTCDDYFSPWVIPLALEILSALHRKMPRNATNSFTNSYSVFYAYDSSTRLDDRVRSSCIRKSLKTPWIHITMGVWNWQEQEIVSRPSSIPKSATSILHE